MAALVPKQDSSPDFVTPLIQRRFGRESLCPPGLAGAFQKKCRRATVSAWHQVSKASDPLPSLSLHARLHIPRYRQELSLPRCIQPPAEVHQFDRCLSSFEIALDSKGSVSPDQGRVDPRLDRIAPSGAPQIFLPARDYVKIPFEALLS